jgi:5'-nucleotidase
MKAAAFGLIAVLGLAAGAAHAHQHGSHESSELEQRFEGAEAREEAQWRVCWRAPGFHREPGTEIKLLGINDFHGQLSPRAIGNRPAGGAAVLASYLRAATIDPDRTLLIHAGDHVGATPPNSALLRDEPAISFLNLLANEHCVQSRGPAQHRPSRPQVSGCNIVGTLGNHEFDEGRGELLRLIHGGNHAAGPFLEAPWGGARFPYVSANVIDTATGKPLVPAYTIQHLGGVKVAVIGAVLKETATIVTPSGVAGLDFIEEATAINQAVRATKRQGVRAIVVTLHQGIRQASYEGPTDPEIGGLAGPLVEIVRQLDDEVDVVISGHAHGFTNALIPNSNGTPILVSQAFSSGTAYGDIDLTISRRSGDVIEKSAAIVTTWADQGPGLAPDAAVAALVAAADARVEPLVARVVGTALQEITRAESASGESALGNLIADAQRQVTNARFAFMNPGGIRADIAMGEVSWGDLFTVHTFGNDLISMDLTGAQIKTLLEQQWSNPNSPRILKTSGLTYSWNGARPVGDRVVEIVDESGHSLVPTTLYRVTVNSFIADGGDGFAVLREGTNRVVGPVDLGALVNYIEGLAQPFSSAIEGRITRLD